MAKITIRDVAKYAGVSLATVSNVINGKGRMSPATKKKVLSAVKRMNFYPDTTAANLSRGKSSAIAFVSSYLSSPFVTSVLSGAESRMHNTGKLKHDIIHYATKGTTALKTTVIEDLLYGKKAGAIIVVTITIKPNLLREFKKRKVGLVLIESKMKGVHSVRADNYGSSCNAVKYLVKKGRRKILFVGGPLKPSALDMDVSPAEVERLQGYKKALADSGIKMKAENIITVPFYNREEGERCMENIVKASLDINAVFCAAGDSVAAGMMDMAKKLKVKIPSDIAVIGYDDIPLASSLRPALTTVRQPLHEMGVTAFDMAAEEIDNGVKGAKDIVLPAELIIRDSA